MITKGNEFSVVLNIKRQGFPEDFSDAFDIRVIISHSLNSLFSFEPSPLTINGDKISFPIKKHEQKRPGRYNVKVVYKKHKEQGVCRYTVCGENIFELTSSKCCCKDGEDYPKIINANLEVGISADGKDGLTPHVGDNGNWWIGDKDTGTPATGPKGDQGDPGDGSNSFWGDIGGEIEHQEDLMSNLQSKLKPNKLGSVEEYDELESVDSNTLYYVPGLDPDGNDVITDAWIGKYKFQIGGGSSIIPVTALYLDKTSITLEKGKTTTLSATYSPTTANQTHMNWNKSNNNVGIASQTGLENVITAVAKGQCVVMIAAESGVTASCEINVIVTLISMNITNESQLVVGENSQIQIKTNPVDANTSLMYSSSNANVVNIDADGNILAVTEGIATITVTDELTNINTSIQFSVQKFAVIVTGRNVDDNDTITTIFSIWDLVVKGSASQYKYKEISIESGVEEERQSIDWTDIPSDGTVRIELYAEFGERVIRWSFRNANGDVVETTTPVKYIEPELIHREFTVDIQCSEAEARAMIMEIPYYKYDKKFVYCLRNDDNLTSLWRMAFRFVNREYMPKVIKRYERTDAVQDALPASEKHRAPRRLGYTDGCGVLIPFVFDAAGMVLNHEGNRSYDTGSEVAVQRSDIEKHKDYGGHFLLHDIAFLASDEVQPKYDNDYSYALQRDRQIIKNDFGYNSTTFANPNGDPYYTQPCIKDPKTLLLSGGGYAFRTPEYLAAGEGGSTYGERFPDAVQFYGLPDHRQFFNWNSDLSNVPLSEIRNTLMLSYVYAENHPYYSKLWLTQHLLSKQGKPSFANELTHGLGYHLESNGNYNEVNAAHLIEDLKFFEEVHDVVGANGEDIIWFCPSDEVIEYMYYQRVANITKELTATGCRFTIAFDIPAYLSYQTYSAIIKNLPATAIIMRGQGVTSFNKNMKTGLINFGYSLETVERAQRYVANYLANPTSDNLDRAWYFTRLLGDLAQPYASQLPAFNEAPVIASVDVPSTTTEPNISITIVNSNKEFGEAEFLDICNNADFNDSIPYKIGIGEHKYYDSLDDFCKQNVFNVSIKPIYNELQSFYVRLRNVHGTSNVVSVSTTLQRVVGENDPAVTFVIRTPYKYNDRIEVDIIPEHISEIRYKVDDVYGNWIPVVSELTIPLLIGEHAVSIEGRNNLGETALETKNINFPGKQSIVVLANVVSGNIEGIGYVNKLDPGNNAQVLYDLDGVQKGSNTGTYYNYNTSVHDAFKVKYGLTNVNATIAVAYWPYPVLPETPGKYPNSFIDGDAARKNIRVYGNVRSATSEQVAYMLTGLEPGVYQVNVLISARSTGYLRNSIRVQGEVHHLTTDNTDYIVDNNSNYIKFNGIVVDEDGYLLISNYSEDLTKSTSSWCAPICVVEIIK